MAPTLYFQRDANKDRWRCHYRLDKWNDGSTYERLKALGLYMPPDEVCEDEGNSITYTGVSDLFTGMISSLSTPYSSTNAQIAVGDSSTANGASPLNISDLQAAAGTAINASNPSGATNTTPIVISGTFSPAAVVGSVYVLAGFAMGGGGVINDTWEATATSNASTITLLNSAGTGSITVTGATIKPINYYRQHVASVSITGSPNTLVLVSNFASANANFNWNEFGITNNAVPPSHVSQHAQQSPNATHLFDRVVNNFGTKAAGNVWQLTVTLSLS